MLRIIKKDLKPARHQDAGSEDDDADDDNLLGIEEDEDIDDSNIDETAESDEQSEDSEAVVGSEGAETEHTEDSDDSDGGMDDEAMFRMDTYLAQIFKEKKNQAGGETAQSQLVLFKLRVLSLLEIYLHENRGKCLFLLVIFLNISNAAYDAYCCQFILTFTGGLVNLSFCGSLELLIFVMYITSLNKCFFFTFQLYTAF